MKAWLYRRHRNSWRTTWFSSHGTRTFERRDYHAIGVREYVIVDHLQRTVLVLLWKQGDYTERLLTANDTYSSELLPGLAIPLWEVFGRES